MKKITRRDFLGGLGRFVAACGVMATGLQVKEPVSPPEKLENKKIAISQQDTNTARLDKDARPTYWVWPDDNPPNGLPSGTYHHSDGYIPWSEKYGRPQTW